MRQRQTANHHGSRLYVARRDGVKSVRTRSNRHDGAAVAGIMIIAIPIRGTETSTIEFGIEDRKSVV